MLARWKGSLVALHQRKPLSTSLSLPAPLPMQPTDQRERLYRAILSKALATMVADKAAVGGLKGALFWQGWVPVRAWGAG